MVIPAWATPATQVVWVRHQDQTHECRHHPNIPHNKNYINCHNNRSIYNSNSGSRSRYRICTAFLPPPRSQEALPSETTSA